MLNDVYLAGPVRTAIGGFNGALAEVPAMALGSAVIRATMQRAGIAAEQVDEVIMGNVLSAGLGQNPARQASIGAGLSPAVGATTVGKVCGSGLKAVMLAAQAIQCGDASAIVAGGMESMSRAPYLLDKARTGYRMGNGQLIDSMLHDGLTDAYSGAIMGTCGDQCAEKYHFTRQQQDDFAVASFKRALAAVSSGVFAREIVPVSAPAGKGTVMVAEDEQPKRFNEEKLRQLRPAFAKEGTITAGNASSINDGAAAVVVLSCDKMQSLGVKPAARILGYATASLEPEWFTIAPIAAVKRLLGMLSLKVADVDLFEINEAFAVVTMAAMKELAIPHEKVNVNGGAVALGHPIGASGARTLVTLLNAMRDRRSKIGIVTLCIGGGEAVAMAVELC
ncbi:MAG TPA: acetyl-CoA C-acyltransferase [Tepidisphaeraceae bacterium]|jgi:acetyl-CoA C-acetyltransferase|nr:acetyl-CoA C-acyltransferase [Tepidisphaeraceae bacterium]